MYFYNMVAQRIQYLVLFLLFQTAFIGIQAQNNDSAIIKKSIDNSIQYLNNRIETHQLYYLTVPLLIPLKEYYQLAITDEIYKTRERLILPEEIDAYDLFTPFFDYHKQTVQKISKKNRSWIEVLNLFPLYCRNGIDKKEFLASFDSALTSGGYDLTHAYLATLTLENTYCIPKGQAKKLEQRAWKELKKTIPLNNTQTYTDLDIETMAMCLYGNKATALTLAHISHLLSMQNPNGSWITEKSDDLLMTDHSTILALWVLLEWQYKNDPTLYLPYVQN
jgi:hypothetical protein